MIRLSNTIRKKSKRALCTNMLSRILTVHIADRFHFTSPPKIDWNHLNGTGAVRKRHAEHFRETYRLKIPLHDNHPRRERHHPFQLAAEHNPPDADRDISTQWPEEGVEMDVETLLRAKGVEPDDND